MVDINFFHDSTENYIVKETFIETNKISGPSFEYVSVLSNFNIKNNLQCQIPVGKRFVLVL